FPGVERVAQGLPAVLDREVDDRRRASVRRGDGAGLEVVGGRAPAERHVEVRVNVDAAGDDVLPGCVDRLIGRQTGKRGLSPISDRGDLFVLDQDVPAVLVGRRDDRSAADQGLQAPISAIGWYVSGRRSRKNCHTRRTSSITSRSISATTSSSLSSEPTARKLPRGSTKYEEP